MCRRPFRLIVLAVTGMAFTAGWAAGRPAAAEQTVGLYVDGQPVEFRSHIIGGVLPPVLVDGHAMIPVRLLNELFHEHLDLHLAQWGVLQVGGLAFKPGVKEVCWAAPAVGGGATILEALPVAPRIINGTHYVPARVVLNLLGHGVEWDGVERALRITRNGAPEKKYENS